MSDVKQQTKKQKKAFNFKEKALKKDAAAAKAEAEAAAKEEAESKKRPLEGEAEVEAGDADAPKKRKTRRGKKGKGVNGGSGPRFILFVGNLPYDTTEADLMGHFRSSEPSRIRLRTDKGIAFIEFDQDTAEVRSKMDIALSRHHSTLKHRKINVELTVGGGGNSTVRVAKLQEKNLKLEEERRTRIEDGKKEAAVKRAKTDELNASGIHPDRANLVG